MPLDLLFSASPYTSDLIRIFTPLKHIWGNEMHKEPWERFWTKLMGQCSSIREGFAGRTLGTENCLPLFGREQKTQIAWAVGPALPHTFAVPTPHHRGKHSPKATEGGNNTLHFLSIVVQRWEISLYHYMDDKNQGFLEARWSVPPLNINRGLRIFKMFSFNLVQSDFSLAWHLGLWVTVSSRVWQFFPSLKSTHTHRLKTNNEPVTDVCMVSGVAYHKKWHCHGPWR